MTPEGWYAVELGLGTPAVPIKVALDTRSEYFAVESELCYKCSSKAYKPGLSSTTHNTGLMWQLDSESNEFSFNVIEFKDTVCLNQQLCILQ